MRLLYLLKILVLLLLVSSASFALLSPLKIVHAETGSSVFIDPVASCCTTIGSSFSVSVLMNLTASEGINGFDVRVDYTNFQIVLKIASIDFSNNVFSRFGPQTLAECIDGFGVAANGGCKQDDSGSGGQVHLAQSILGTVVQGPQESVPLFTIFFDVLGSGSSLFSMDRANLLNPGVVPLPSPRYVQVVTRSGVFGNAGIVAFFDFVPTVPPAILPGEQIVFDAGASFNASDGAQLAGARYSWKFGDGAPLDTSGPLVRHTFGVAGIYLVELNITMTDNSLWTIQRPVIVKPALGDLQIFVRDESGTLLRAGVVAAIFNSSLSTVAFQSFSVSGAGIVNFTGLSPGPYLVKFSGSAVVPKDLHFDVAAGVTNLETAYLKSSAGGFASGDLATIIYLSVIGGGLAVVVGVIVLQRRSRKKRGSSVKSRKRR